MNSSDIKDGCCSLVVNTNIFYPTKNVPKEQFKRTLKELFSKELVFQKNTNEKSN